MLMLYVLTMVTRLRLSAYNDLATADDVRRIRSIQYGVSKLKWTNVAGCALILYPCITASAVALAIPVGSGETT
jgi:hypothetical protein